MTRSKTLAIAENIVVGVSNGATFWCALAAGSYWQGRVGVGLSVVITGAFVMGMFAGGMMGTILDRFHEWKVER